MKTFRIILCLISFLVITTSYGQSQITEKKTGWGGSQELKLGIGIFDYDEPGFKYEPIPCIEVGYMYIARPSGSPFYVELGANAYMAYGKFFEDDVFINNVAHELSARMSIVSIKIPFNFACRIRINDKNSIDPYVGVYQRINLYGKAKYRTPDGTIKEDIFDDAIKANRHQAGVNCGVKFKFKSWSLGVNAEYDFLDFCREGGRAETYSLLFGINL